LINAVKELSQKNETQNQIIESLQQRIDRLEKILNNIKLDTDR